MSEDIFKCYLYMREVHKQVGDNNANGQIDNKCTFCNAPATKHININSSTAGANPLATTYMSIINKKQLCRNTQETLSGTRVILHPTRCVDCELGIPFHATDDREETRMRLFVKIIRKRNDERDRKDEEVKEKAKEKARENIKGCFMLILLDIPYIILSLMASLCGGEKFVNESNIVNFVIANVCTVFATIVSNTDPNRVLLSRNLYFCPDGFCTSLSIASVILAMLIGMILIMYLSGTSV